jgi:hypothetical protein
MANRDGSGPVGAGAMTGRGLGICTGAGLNRDDARFMGFGRACKRGFGRGFGRGFAADARSSKTQKELLEEQKNILKDRLEAIDQRLESL